MRSLIVHALCHLETRVFFVNSIVGQVHVEVIELCFVCIRLDWLVQVCRESYETLLIEENFEWLTGEDNHIETQIELQAVEKVRILHILLDNIDVVFGDLVNIVRQENAFPLTATVGFDNHREARFLALLADRRSFPRLFNDGTLWTEGICRRGRDRRVLYCFFNLNR